MSGDTASGQCDVTDESGFGLSSCGVHPGLRPGVLSHDGGVIGMSAVHVEIDPSGIRSGHRSGFRSRRPGWNVLILVLKTRGRKSILTAVEIVELRCDGLVI